MIVPNMGGGGAVRHIQRGFSSSATIALSGFKNLDKMFVEVESGTTGSGKISSTTGKTYLTVDDLYTNAIKPSDVKLSSDGSHGINGRSTSGDPYVSSISGFQSTTSAHISAFSLTSMTLKTPTPVMYQVIEFS